MKSIVWLLVLLLIILHQDFWNWHRSDLVWGILPIGLVYHMGLSVMAAVVWYLATRYAWPTDTAVEEPKS